VTTTTLLVSSVIVEKTSALPKRFTTQKMAKELISYLLWFPGNPALMLEIDRYFWDDSIA